MRIALLVDAYAPARTSAAIQMRDLARELIAQGHTPTVIVPSANLRAVWCLENLDGVQVLRVRALRTKDVGYVRRTIAEFLLPFLALYGLRKSPLRGTRWEGLVWYSPTIFFGPMVASLKRRNDCRAYLALRDIFPDWAVDAGVMRKGFAYKFLKLVERFQYSVADVIGVQTHANLAHLDEWDCPPRRRVEVLMNWLANGEHQHEKPILCCEALTGKTIFVYAGNMGVAQAMDCFIELAERMRHRKDIGFLFVGRGSEVSRLQSLAARNSLGNVVFHDEIEPSEIPGLLAHCHVGLLSLDPRHKTHNIPGKFLSYLQAGLPVLARINSGNDLETLIDKHGVGRVSVGGSAEELQLLAEDLVVSPARRLEMGARGKELARNTFSVTSATRQVVEGLQQLNDD